MKKIAKILAIVAFVSANIAYAQTDTSYRAPGTQLEDKDPNKFKGNIPGRDNSYKRDSNRTTTKPTPDASTPRTGTNKNTKKTKPKSNKNTTR